MCSINLLWSTDLCQDFNFLDFLFNNKPKPIYSYKLSAFVNDIIQSDIEIDAVCSSQEQNAVLTSLAIQHRLDKLRSSNLSNIYSLPFINDLPVSDIELMKLTNIENVNILRQIPDIPLYSSTPSDFESFEKHILPIVKDLAWAKTHTYKNYNKIDSIRDYNVLIISHSNFIKNTFNVELQPCQVVCKKYKYTNISDKNYTEVTDHSTQYFKTKTRTIIHAISKRPFLY